MADARTGPLADAAAAAAAAASSSAPPSSHLDELDGEDDIDEDQLLRIMGYSIVGAGATAILSGAAIGWRAGLNRAAALEAADGSFVPGDAAAREPRNGGGGRQVPIKWDRALGFSPGRLALKAFLYGGAIASVVVGTIGAGILLYLDGRRLAEVTAPVPILPPIEGAAGAAAAAAAAGGAAGGGADGGDGAGGDAPSSHVPLAGSSRVVPKGRRPSEDELAGLSPKERETVEEWVLAMENLEARLREGLGGKGGKGAGKAAVVATELK
jgi:hypothetical protein